MMRLADSVPEVLACCDPIDFRKGINGLSILVEQALEQNPFSERLFVFTNRRQDNKVKILCWERNGFCLRQKRLEEDRFHWPRATVQAVISLSGQQLNWLLDGFDLQNRHPHAPLDYQGAA